MLLPLTVANGRFILSHWKWMTSGYFIVSGLYRCDCRVILRISDWFLRVLISCKFVSGSSSHANTRLVHVGGPAQCLLSCLHQRRDAFQCFPFKGGHCHLKFGPSIVLQVFVKFTHENHSSTSPRVQAFQEWIINWTQNHKQKCIRYINHMRLNGYLSALHKISAGGTACKEALQVWEQLISLGCNNYVGDELLWQSICPAYGQFEWVAN